MISRLARKVARIAVGSAVSEREFVDRVMSMPRDGTEATETFDFGSGVTVDAVTGFSGRPDVVMCSSWADRSAEDVKRVHRPVFEDEREEGRGLPFPVAGGDDNVMAVWMGPDRKPDEPYEGWPGLRQYYGLVTWAVRNLDRVPDPSD
jgi:hypothetical protein